MALTEELKNELTNFIIRQFQELPDFSDDPKEISEYIVLLISNGRSQDELFQEVSDLVSTEGLKTVIEKTYDAINSYNQQQLLKEQQLQQQEQQLQQQQQEQLQQQQQQLLQTSLPEQTLQNNGGIQPESNGISRRSIPTQPASLASRIGSNGIGKKYNNNNTNGPRNSAFKNPAAFEKALNLSNDSFKVKKKGRCHKFPHCPHGRDCIYAHPTKTCFQFPNCPNTNGNCTYLHPGEDDELIAELEKTRQEHQNQKRESYQKFASKNSGITLCKFGTLCTNPQCPFGHPNPANEDAKVIKFEWCAENLQCTNPSCDKAHSSLSKIKPVQQSQPFNQQAPQQQQQEKSLEACKFGTRCTNRFCKFRHALSPIPCRDGENCTRIDCLFTHPLNEECRFGESCKNPKCLFNHPNGKNPAAAPTGNLTWTKTNERQFAVPEDQVLEQAPPQQAD